MTEEDCIACGCRGYVSHDVQDGLAPWEEFVGHWNDTATTGQKHKNNPWVAVATIAVKGTQDETD